METGIDLPFVIWLNVGFVAALFGAAGVFRLLDWLLRKRAAR